MRKAIVVDSEEEFRELSQISVHVALLRRGLTPGSEARPGLYHQDTPLALMVLLTVDQKRQQGAHLAAVFTMF